MILHALTSCAVLSAANTVLLSPSSLVRLSTSVAKPAVQVVTHLCYSDFQDIMEAVDAMDGEQQRAAC
jgi:methionine synthase II (cobalamin-independent)